MTQEQIAEHVDTLFNSLISERKRLYDEREELERRISRQTEILREACGKIGHVDNGGFMYGHCVHCGEEL